MSPPGARRCGHRARVEAGLRALRAAARGSRARAARHPRARARLPDRRDRRSAVLRLCDGRAAFADIVAATRAAYSAPVEVIAATSPRCCRASRTSGCCATGPTSSPPPPLSRGGAGLCAFAGGPAGLLAELTHRCPLQCPYCSNPLELERANGGAQRRGLGRGVPSGRRDGRAATASFRRRADRAARSRPDFRPRRRGRPLHQSRHRRPCC